MRGFICQIEHGVYKSSDRMLVGVCLSMALTTQADNTWRKEHRLSSYYYDN